jgi:hypothetical protein
MSEGKSA